MILDDALQAVDDVAADLPFAVGDYLAANQVFRRWRKHGSDEDYALLVKWLYCYSRRYFIIKWTRQPDLPPSEIEELISHGFRRCHEHLHSVDDPDTFAGYVSVICRNTFLNLCRQRSRRPTIALEKVNLDDLVGGVDEGVDAYDLAMLVAAVGRAVERFPKALRTVAELRILGGLDYDEIMARTGYSRATLRSYNFKAITKIRENPHIAALMRDWQGDGPTGGNHAR